MASIMDANVAAAIATDVAGEVVNNSSSNSTPGATTTTAAAAPAAATPLVLPVKADADADADTTSSSENKRKRSGRKPSPVWDYFTGIRTDHNTVHAQCNFCSWRCAGVASRMVQHIISKCRTAPAETASALASCIAAEAATAKKKHKTTDEHAVAPFVQPQLAMPLDAPALVEPQTATTAVTKSPKRVRSALATAATTTPIQSVPQLPSTAVVVNAPLTPQQIATAHEQLVLACVLHDVPLAIVEDAALAAAFHALRPDFVLPTTEAAQTRVLDALVCAALSAQNAALDDVKCFTVLHCNSSLHSNSSGQARTLWLGIDGARDVQLLATTPATTTSNKNSSSNDEDADAAALADAEATLTRQFARLPATATLGFCTDAPQVFQYVRDRQHARVADASAADNNTNNSNNSNNTTADKNDSDAHSSDSQMDRPPLDARVQTALLGTCLVQQTAALLTQLLALVPTLTALLHEAAAVVSALSLHPQTRESVRAAVRALSLDSAGDDADWMRPMQLVTLVLALERDVRSIWSKSEHARTPFRGSASVAAAVAVLGQLSGSDDVVDDSRAAAAASAALPPLRVDAATSFWTELREAHALLAPFRWAKALSESDSGDVTSAQFLLLWLWLLATANASPSVSPTQREALAALTVATIRLHVDDHALACLLLDPRVHGAGLSATGKRKAKGLVVQVAARVCSAAAFDVAGAASRAQLLAHLGSYTQRTAQFADDVAWEMSAGRPAALFWDDYVDDARELAMVAHAVVRFVPHTQSRGVRAAVAAAATASSAVLQPIGNGASSSSSSVTDNASDVAVRIQQVKQLYQQPQPPSQPKQNDATADSSASASTNKAPLRVTAEDAIARHAHVLLPIGASSVMRSTVATRRVAPAAIESVAEKAVATHALRALADGLERLLSVRGNSSADDRSSAASSSVVVAVAKNASDASMVTRERFEVAVDDAWFAVRTESECKEIERAVARFVLPSVVSVATRV